MTLISLNETSLNAQLLPVNENQSICFSVRFPAAGRGVWCGGQSVSTAADILSSVPQLCHAVVDALCGRQAPRRSDYSSAACSPEEWLHLLDSLTALFCLAVGNNSSDQEVRGSIDRSSYRSIKLSIYLSICLSKCTFRNVFEKTTGEVFSLSVLQTLTGLSGVASSRAEVVLDVLRSRQLEIRRALLLRTDSISSSTLHDFDWQLKVSRHLFQSLSVTTTGGAHLNMSCCY